MLDTGAELLSFLSSFPPPKNQDILAILLKNDQQTILCMKVAQRITRQTMEGCSSSRDGRLRTDGQQNRLKDRETLSDFLTVVVPLLLELTDELGLRP